MNSDDVGKLVAGTVAALAGIAAFWPKFRKNVARDNLDTEVAKGQTDMVDTMHESYEKQIKSVLTRLTNAESRIEEMNTTIHRQQVRLTITSSLMHYYKSQLVLSGTKIAPHILSEHAKLERLESLDDEAPHEPPTEDEEQP